MSPAVPIVFAHWLDDVRGADERLIEKLMTRLVSFKTLICGMTRRNWSVRAALIRA
jgi:hypothetical protein